MFLLLKRFNEHPALLASRPRNGGAGCQRLDQLLIVNRVAILASLPGYHFVVLDAVEQEVQRPEQQIVLADAFEENLIDRAGPATPEELAIFAAHRKVTGLGEAACLAAAEQLPIPAMPTTDSGKPIADSGRCRSPWSSGGPWGRWGSG